MAPRRRNPSTPSRRTIGTWGLVPSPSRAGVRRRGSGVPLLAVVAGSDRTTSERLPRPGPPHPRPSRPRLSRHHPPAHDRRATCPPSTTACSRATSPTRPSSRPRGSLARAAHARCALGPQRLRRHRPNLRHRRHRRGPRDVRPRRRLGHRLGGHRRWPGARAGHRLHPRRRHRGQWRPQRRDGVPGGGARRAARWAAGVGHPRRCGPTRRRVPGGRALRRRVARGRPADHRPLHRHQEPRRSQPRVLLAGRAPVRRGGGHARGGGHPPVHPAVDTAGNRRRHVTRRRRDRGAHLRPPLPVATAGRHVRGRSLRHRAV